jgi:hypothetical protein
MERLIDAMRFKLGVDGLSQAGFGEAEGLRAFDVEMLLEVRRGEMLHDGIVREILQNLVPVDFGDVGGDEDEMQFALVGAQSIAAHE